MAIFHLHVKNISRGDGRSALAAAAYRAGEGLWNQAEEKISKFGGERRVVCQGLHLPDHAPRWMADRAQFWNALEAASKRADARFAKEIEASLPRELSVPEWTAIVLGIVRVYTERGVVVDFAIHDDSTKHNPHVHMLLSNLSVTADGFGRANRDLIKRDFLTEARRLWRELVNSALGNAGISARIDERSYKDRGIERGPTSHRGPDPRERQANRDALKGRGRAMNLESEMIEARKQLLQAKDVKERFPLLASRPDWPPIDKQMPPGLSHYEKAEFAMFWREVADRALDDRQRVPALAPASARVAPEAPVRSTPETRLRTLREPGLPEDRFVSLRRNIPEWKDLHDELIRRMSREGWRTDGPLDDFTVIKAAIERFEARLQDFEALRAENARLRAQWAEFERQQVREMPVPDPRGEPISQDQLHRAQDAMLAEHARPDRPELRTPRPENVDDPRGRAAAAAAVARANRREAPEMPIRPTRAPLSPQPEPGRDRSPSPPPVQVNRPPIPTRPGPETSRSSQPPAPTRPAPNLPERQRLRSPAPPPTPQVSRDRPTPTESRQPPMSERAPPPQTADRRMSMDELMRRMAETDRARDPNHRSRDDDRDY